MQQDIKTLKGVGDKTAQELNKLGIFTINDIIHFYPRDYEDWTNVQSIEEVYKSGKRGCIRVKIDSEVKRIFLSKGKTIFKVRGSDGQNNISIIFFNTVYMAISLTRIKNLLLFGTVSKNNFNEYQIYSPKISQNMGIFPIYSQTKNITSLKIKNSVKTALEKVQNSIEETLPSDILEKYNLCSLNFAIKNIHFPENKDKIEKAKRRLIFEEILIWQIGMSKIKNYVKQKTNIKIKKDFSDEFLFLLPFVLTKAQLRVINECTEDMLNTDGLAMSRLIQGDVGSGKTVVAAAVAYNAIKNGYQTAVMAPTEILSNQHYNTFNKIFQGMNINIGLLSGKLKGKKRKNLEDKIKNKEIDIVIGTHALISENLKFANLGLVITDEQHRFGVRQRMKLAEKGKNPHVLIMSATPIPRTLSMMIYGDLDISILDELPPGRKEVKTFCISPQKKERAFKFFKEIIKNGGQGYIVCPLIENSENEMFSTDDYKNTILNETFGGYTSEILHGRLSANEKEAIMKRFSCGEIQILVATTVIEVGVDVPNASIIIIENAERFGLSQLHQLRGRVGRGEKESYCVLISYSGTKDTKRRMQAMCSTNDGFFLAEEDLKIRGPGEIFGNKQHGIVGIKLAKALKDIKVIEDSKKAVREILSGNYLNQKSYQPIKEKIFSLINYAENHITI